MNVFIFRLFFALCSSFVMTISVYAQENQLLGRWRMLDDSTGNPKASILIYESRGGIEGKIDKLLQEGAEKANPRCEKCEGALKNQAFLGLVILSGLSQSAPDKWRGRILDPENGKTYDAIVTPIAGGEKLDVHGYIGIQLFGRRQVWQREH